MDKILSIYRKDPELALSLINGVHWIECIKFHIRMGWKKDMLKKLRSRDWFVTWQYHCRELFKYLDKFIIWT